MGKHDYDDVWSYTNIDPDLAARTLDFANQAAHDGPEPVAAAFLYAKRDPAQLSGTSFNLVLLRGPYRGETFRFDLALHDLPGGRISVGRFAFPDLGPDLHAEWAPVLEAAKADLARQEALVGRGVDDEMPPAGKDLCL